MYCVCIIAKLRQQRLQTVEDGTDIPASLIFVVVKSEHFLSPDPKLDVVDCLDKSIAIAAFPAYIAAHMFSQSMLEYAHIEAW